MPVSEINFLKMDGLGNDFVIIDARRRNVALTTEQVQKISARNNSKTGGCDQLIIIENSQKADCFMRIYNGDGGQVDACGNATRCVGYLLLEEGKKDEVTEVTIETNAGIFRVNRFPIMAGISNPRKINVVMKLPEFDFDKIPYNGPKDESVNKVVKEFLKRKGSKFATHKLFEKEAVLVNVGNPHIVFMLDNFDIVKKDWKEVGREIENLTELFPKRINVGFAGRPIKTDDAGDNTYHLELHVWERGAGATKACGTGACAAAAAFSGKEGTEKRYIIRQKGGELEISFTTRRPTRPKQDNSTSAFSGEKIMLMTGAVSEALPGTLEL